MIPRAPCARPPTPAEDEHNGDQFTFEKGAAIAGGGWADVWKKGFFV
jgi:hypothetical protein